MVPVRANLLRRSGHGLRRRSDRRLRVPCWGARCAYGCAAVSGLPVRRRARWKHRQPHRRLCIGRGDRHSALDNNRDRLAWRGRTRTRRGPEFGQAQIGLALLRASRLEARRTRWLGAEGSRFLPVLLHLPSYPALSVSEEDLARMASSLAAAHMHPACSLLFEPVESWSVG